MKVGDLILDIARTPYGRIIRGTSLPERINYLMGFVTDIDESTGIVHIARTPYGRKHGQRSWFKRNDLRN